MASDWVGKTIDGRYEVESVLGEGGMGIVLRARHRVTHAAVALKLLHSHISVRGDLVERFLAEAQAPARIRHAGIAAVTDAGTTSSGEPYLVMELLDGETLADLVTRERLPLERIRTIGLVVLDALGAAHEAGFVHRDLKPENVFITRPNGSPKLLDFGIAKVLGRLGTPPGGVKRSTIVGQVLGTLGYMSPEQLRDSKSVDARTDLWAVGVMLYEMMTGAMPYEANDYYGMVTAVETGSPTPLWERLANVPRTFDEFFEQALAKRPEDRFASASAMADALRALPQISLSRRDAAAVDLALETDLAVTTTQPSVFAVPRVGRIGPSAPERRGAPAAESHGDRDAHHRTREIPALESLAPPPMAATAERAIPKSAARFDMSLEGPAIPALEPRQQSTPDPWISAPRTAPPAEPTPAVRRQPVAKSRIPWGAVIAAVVGIGAVAAGVLAFSLRDKAAPPPAVVDAASAPRPSATATASSSAPVLTPAPGNARCPGAMVLVQGATFSMGSREGEGDDDERPRHQVAVSSFCMDETEVTVAAYKACMEKTPAHCSAPDAAEFCNASRPASFAQHPINCVELKQAMSYCATLGKRLPTEDEWELAARGPDGRKYPWGEAAPGNQLCWDGEGSALGRGKRFSTCAAGANPKGDTALGVKDLAGNVSEWTTSLYCAPYGSKNCPAVRVIRGGSWDGTDPNFMRSADRDWRAPTVRNRSVGFRCVNAPARAPLR